LGNRRNRSDERTVGQTLKPRIIKERSEGTAQVFHSTGFSNGCLLPHKCDDVFRSKLLQFGGLRAKPAREEEPHIISMIRDRASTQTSLSLKIISKLVRQALCGGSLHWSPEVLDSPPIREEVEEKAQSLPVTLFHAPVLAHVALDVTRRQIFERYSASLEPSAKMIGDTNLHSDRETCIALFSQLICQLLKVLP
jgi:hypothetical protein